MITPSPAPAKSAYLPGVPLLRVLGATAVVYTHLASWYTARGRAWTVADLLNVSLVESLHLIKDLEVVGVSLFLLVTGLVVTQAATKETPGQFGARRAVRILPALWVAVAVAFPLVNSGLLRPGEGTGPVGPLTLLSNMTLVEFFLSPHVILIGSTWTLVVQVAFYAFTALTIPILRRWPWLVPALGATVCSVVLSLVWDARGMAYEWIGVIAAYMPMIFIGQVVALARSGRMPTWAAAALGTGHFLLFVKADMIGRYVAIGDARPRTLFVVVLVVLVTMNANGRLASHPATSTLAVRTYSLYLVHQMALYPVLDALFPVWGELPALAVGLAVTVVATEVVHRFVEAPVVRRYRDWEKRRRQRPAPRHRRAPESRGLARS